MGKEVVIKTDDVGRKRKQKPGVERSKKKKKINVRYKRKLKFGRMKRCDCLERKLKMGNCADRKNENCCINVGR